MVVWFDRYLERLEVELTVKNESRAPTWVNFFVSQAYAVTGSAKTKFIEQFRKFLEQAELDLPDVKDYETFTPLFNHALARFIRLSEDANYQFKNVSDDFDVLRAFIKVGQLGDGNTVKAFAHNGGYRLGLTAEQFLEPEFMKAIAELPIEDLSSEAQKCLLGLFNQLKKVVTITTSGKEYTNFSFTKGHIAHILMVADMMKGNKYEITGIEVDAAPFTSLIGTKFPVRRDDLIVIVKDAEVNIQRQIEIKNWLSTTWKDNLRDAMPRTVKSTNKETKVVTKSYEIGQLFTDLVRYMDNGNKGRQMMFTPDVIEPGLTPAAMEDKILKHIDKLIDDNNVNLAREFGINLNDKKLSNKVKKEWRDKIIELKQSLKGLDANAQKFVSVYPYNNITK